MARPRTDIVVIDMPGSGQAAVAVARNTLARTDPRYYRAIVANAVLGGGYSARLNQEIRIRRGLSYGAGSDIDARGRPGPFVATVQTRNDAAAEVLGLILGEMRRLGAEPVPAAELARAARLADRRFRADGGDDRRHGPPDRRLCAGAASGRRRSRASCRASSP